MDLNRKIYKTTLGGEEASLEVSELANQANAAVLGRHGETVVLATVVMSKENRQSGFFPLTVDYEERFYAVGKILGSRFMRREGRPSDEATLSARLIDRTLRPLFDQRMRREIQITITVLSYDEIHDPDAISLLAVSAALGISNIPWGGPVGGVSMVSDDAPKYNAFFAGPKDKVNMIELDGDELSDEKVLELFESSQKEMNKLIDFQEEIIKKIGKPKIEITFPEASSETKKIVAELVKKELSTALKNKEVGSLESELLESLEEKGVSDEELKAAKDEFEKESERYVKNQILEEGKRPDDRAIDEVRPLYGEVGLFKRIHGSGLFIRGNTQILAMTTLAPPSAEKLEEGMKFSGRKRFMLHYNFPKFSVGEAGRSRGPGRRDIGHGALAAKAIKNFLPSKEEFPYTIRVVAETLSSNGSSSMASTCATSLSLMDAGVHLKCHVAGIAMGLITLGNKWEIITDIQGPEDHYGDMDLKIAGSKNGISAVQMDVKIDGITKEMFKKALPQAEKARLEILEVMNKTIPAPRKHLSPYAPTILTINVPVEKIGGIIGPGGKTINGIIDKAGGDVSIDIDDDGRVYVSATDSERANEALGMVKEVVREYEVGEIIDGVVAKILDFGAIVEFGWKQSGMVHVSELADGYVKDVKNVVKEGDKVRAKIIKKENGKTGLTLKGIEQ